MVLCPPIWQLGYGGFPRSPKLPGNVQKSVNANVQLPGSHQSG